MVRGQSGIDDLLNLVNTAHSAMKILPYQTEVLKECCGRSTHEVRFAISEQIHRQVFFAGLGEKFQRHCCTFVATYVTVLSCRLICCEVLERMIKST